jgi:hypothetical protein
MIDIALAAISPIRIPVFVQLFPQTGQDYEVNPALSP